MTDIREPGGTGGSRRAFLGGLSALGVASLLAACGDSAQSGPTDTANAVSALTGGKRLTAAFSNAGDAPGPVAPESWSNQGKTAAQTWANWLGVDVTWYDGKQSIEAQRAAVEDMATKHFDFVAIQAVAVDTLVDPIQKLLDKKIPVIQMDTHIDSRNALAITTAIEPDNIFMASTVTDALFQKMGGTGKVIMTQGALAHTGAQARAKGFHQTLLKYPAIDLLADDPADWDVNKVAQLWKTYLARYPQIDGAFFHNDRMALAGIDVITAAGRTIPVVSVDDIPNGIRAVSNGSLLMTVRNPSGRIHWTALILGIMAATGKKDIPPYILADGPVVSQANAAGLLFLEQQSLL